MTQGKRLRRMFGFFRARLPELRLRDVRDPRSRRGRKWRIEQLLSTVLCGMMAGCKSLAKLESLGDWLSLEVRQRLRLPEKIADTTCRDALCRLNVESVRQVLHRAVRAARRRKALQVIGLPFHMVALDGKATALPNGTGPYAQWHRPEEGKPYALLRTTTATLATASGKPCIDVLPIAAHTNEMGHFATAFGELVRVYGKLFRLVSYDAGAGCEENGRIVRAAGKHFLFRLNNPEWHVHQLATELLEHSAVAAEQPEVRNNQCYVVRRLKMFAVNEGKLPQLARKSAIWADARVLLLVQTQTFEKEVCTSSEEKLYISSLPPQELTAKQWLFATVRHWAVETTHQVLDTVFDEDEHPWIEADPNGMLIVLVLRRVAYTLLTLFRSVTLRSEDNRLKPWAAFTLWVRAMLTKTTGDMLVGLRPIKDTAAAG